MKLSNHTSPSRFLFSSFLIVLLTMLSSFVANAHPFASSITPTNNSGFVSFILNESGGNVTITYEDGSTNTVPGFDGVSTGSTNLPSGSYSFLLEPPHTSFQISVYKQGNGTPFLITSDANTNGLFGTPRGIASMKNTKIGIDFGRVALCSAAADATHARVAGLYLFNADESFVKLGVANDWFVNSGNAGPWKVKANDDGTWTVTDFSTAQAAAWNYSADMSSSNLLLGPINQNVAVAAGAHGDMAGGARMFGSLAGGDLRVYTWDGGMGAPSDTNCIKGPLTGPGSYNCIFEYWIGAGPIGSGGWQKRPDYAYTMGLDGIAELQVNGTIGNDGKPITVYGRANGSNPDVTFLRPFPLTNGITGDLVNKTNQDMARDGTNWLYTGGVYNPPGNFPPPGGTSTDPWAGINGSGSIGGAQGGGAVSLDGKFFVTMDVNNGLTIASLTNGIPNEGTIFGIANTPSTTIGRGVDFDPADNIWTSSSGQGRIRCWSLGLTTTCVTSNDWTGTNNSFSLSLPPIQASIALQNGLASQNYVNNQVNAGTPIPGVFRINLSTTSNAAPVIVTFVRTGSATAPTFGVGSISLTAAGSDYTNSPTVGFSGGGGSGATATCIIDTNAGIVTNLTLTAAGTGYTSVPTVTFTGGGGSNAAASATLVTTGGNYAINVDETPNGVTVLPNAVIFPAGQFTGSNGPNWNVDVKFTPTATPLSGPVTVVNVRLTAGTNYSTQVPFNTSIAILNTGPQLIQLSAASPSSFGNMTRAIPHDQARFVLTRLGDTNGPGNDAINPVVARSFTITNVDYLPPAAGRFITGLTLTSAGTFYTNSPTVSFSASGGSGAAATAIIDTNAGIVTNLTLTASGSGYTATPTVTFVGGTTGAVATAVASVDSTLMAHPGVDFTARAQKSTGGLPSDSANSIVINPGEVTIQGLIGNPVKHTNLSQTKTNLSVVISITNICNTVATPSCSTNLLSSEGYPYLVNTTSPTLQEFDNAVGGSEFVIWSNPLTNAADSTNWTIVHGAIWLTDTNGNSGSPTLPIVFTNYNNSWTNIGGNPAYVWFGKPVHDTDNDFGAFGGIDVPQSETMLANNWSNALKVTINKSGAQGEAGVNIYPQIPGVSYNPSNSMESNFMVFNGNYALRFDMFLDLYDFGLNNGAIGTPAREYAAFGMNHYGTNVNWRLDINPRALGTGAFPINADGMWCCINAASGAITPADYDMFISPPWIIPIYDNTGANTNAQIVPYTTRTFVGNNASGFPPFTNAYQSGTFFPGITNVFANGGVPNDQQSANNNSVTGSPAVPNSVQSGIIKNPPFSGINHLGGAPDNAWIDVSLELSRQTNFALKMAQQQIFSSSSTNGAFGVKNPLAPFSGVPMLGYLDPDQDRADASAFVYYSNIRLVELSPFIPWTNQAVAGIIVTQGGSFSLTSGATYAAAGASGGLTNIWYKGTTNGPNTLGSQDNGTPTLAAFAGQIVNTNDGTNAITMANTGTNVILNATNAITTLVVTNMPATGTNYISTWADAAGTVTGFVSIVESITIPATTTAKATNGTSLASIAVTASGNAPPTSFQWKRNGANIANSTKYAGATAATLFITNVTPADAGLYSNVVANAFGSVIAVGQLNVNVAPGAGTAVTPSALTTNWGAPVTLTVIATNSAFANGVVTPAPTYQWKKGGVNLANGGPVSGATSSAVSINGVNQSTYGGPGNLYAVGVTNSAGGTLSSSAQLTVVLQPYNFTSVLFSPSNVVMSFVSTNTWDTTNAFTLQSAGDVTGPYTNDTSATFSVSGGGFSVTTTNIADSQKFYRLTHSN